MKNSGKYIMWLLVCAAGLGLFVVGCGGSKAIKGADSGEEYRTDSQAAVEPDTSENGSSDLDKIAALPPERGS